VNLWEVPWQDLAYNTHMLEHSPTKSQIASFLQIDSKQLDFFTSRETNRASSIVNIKGIKQFLKRWLFEYLCLRGFNKYKSCEYPDKRTVGFTGSGETLNKGGIPVFLLLCLKKKEARGREA
jgi:hypothetical protein